MGKWEKWIALCDRKENFVGGAAMKDFDQLNRGIEG
jgi:hypothetical protein